MLLILCLFFSNMFTLRSQSQRIVAAFTCAETHILGGNAGRGGHCEGLNHVVGGCIPLKPYSLEPTSSMRSFLWSRNLSSEAGTRYSDGEDELKDGFSDLETLPESDKIEDITKTRCG